MPPVRYRLGSITRVAIYAIATLTDIIQMILLIAAVGAIINTIVSLAYYFVFGTICFFNNVQLFSTKQLKKTLGTWFGEALPIINFLPWFLIGAYLTIRQTDEEDRMKHHANQQALESLRPAPKPSKNIGSEVIKKAAIILLCLLPLGALAETKIITTPDLTIKVTPADPGPNTPVIINLDSYSFDIGRARIVWTVNGRETAGYNNAGISFTTGEVGTLTNVRAQIKPFGERERTLTISIIPAQVDLLWRGDTYTPQDYLGGKRISIETTGQVVALPLIIDQTKKPISPEQLVYTWLDNGREMAPASGLGKDTYVFKAPIGGTKEIKVIVETIDGRLRAQQTALIPIAKPELRFYVDNALTGPNYAKALTDNFKLTGERALLRVEPYFFPNSLVKGGDLIYRWSLNGRALDNLGPVLGVESGNRSGTANLEVAVNNPLSLFQLARAALNVTLGESVLDNF